MALLAFSWVFLLLFLTVFNLTSCYANKLGLDFHHRFSDKVREWAESRGLPPSWMPDEAPRGSLEYYQTLIKHDLHRHHGRSLADGDLYAFARGNETTMYIGNLQYAFVNLGTPNQTFLVALDTGSPLFWVPCHCKQCAATSDPSYGNIVFRNYEPEKSSTSKMISCSSDQCFTSARSRCTNKTADCTYTIGYGFENTSSSGTLVEDDLYLTKEDKTSKLVKLPIVFGCGEVQTGDLLDGGPPNGLMGLGFSTISVPSMIANSGLTADSFSMCFGRDGYGRLNFGDKGSDDQYETKLNKNSNGWYNISLTNVGVETNISKLSFTAIVDSGTTYSRFTDNIYTTLGDSFSAQVSEEPVQFENFPFEYCFAIRANQTKLFVPTVFFMTAGGSSFDVLHPIALIYKRNSDRPYAYCLAMVRSGINIIGENFLIGNRIVFNREKEVLGWMPYNCYDGKNTSAAAPAPAPVLPTPVPSVLAPSPTKANPNNASSRYVGQSIIISFTRSAISMALILLLLY